MPFLAFIVASLVSYEFFNSRKKLPTFNDVLSLDLNGQVAAKTTVRRQQWRIDTATDGDVDVVDAHVVQERTRTGAFGMTYNGPQFTDANIGTLCSAQGC